MVNRPGMRKPTVPVHADGQFQVTDQERERFQPLAEAVDARSRARGLPPRTHATTNEQDAARAVITDVIAAHMIFVFSPN